MTGDYETTQISKNEMDHHPFIRTFSFLKSKLTNTFKRDYNIKKILIDNDENEFLDAEDCYSYASSSSENFWNKVFFFVDKCKFKNMFFHNLKYDGNYIINDLLKLGYKNIESWKGLEENLLHPHHIKNTENNYYIYEEMIKENYKKLSWKKIPKNFKFKDMEGIPKWLQNLYLSITNDKKFYYFPSMFNLLKLSPPKTFQYKRQENKEYIYIKIKTPKNNILEIKCSAKILNYTPLKYLGEMVNIKKESENFGYDTIRKILPLKNYDKKEIKYALYDTIILAKFINLQEELSEKNDTIIHPKKWMYSASGNAYNLTIYLIFKNNLDEYIKKGIVRKSIDTLQQQVNYSVKKIETGKWTTPMEEWKASKYLYNSIFNIPNLTIKQHDTINNIYYRGGVSAVNYHLQALPKKAVGIDVRSMYPFIMNSNYLLGIGKNLTINRIVEDKKIYQFFTMEMKEDYEINCWKFLYILKQEPGKIQWRNTFKKGEKIPLDTNTYLFLKKHFPNFIKCLKLVKIDFSQHATTFNNIFGETMRQLYKNKKDAAEKIKNGENVELNKILKDNAKLTMNSFYGKNAQKLLQISRVGDEKIYENILNTDDLKNRFDNKIAASVTFAARIHLTIPTINNYAGVYYSDTDSLYLLKNTYDKIKNNLDMSDELGAWEVEESTGEEGRPFMAIRSKKYIIAVTETKWKVTIAGLDKKKASQNLNNPLRLLTKIETEKTKPKIGDIGEYAKWELLKRANKPIILLPNETGQIRFNDDLKIVENNFKKLGIKHKKDILDLDHDWFLIYYKKYHPEVIKYIIKEWEKILPTLKENKFWYLE